MDDLISRQAALASHQRMYDAKSGIEWVPVFWIKNLSSAQPDNKVHLCDSCQHTYPECPCNRDDVIFGNGTGNDNICACSKYVLRVERKNGKWLTQTQYCNKHNLVPSGLGAYFWCSCCEEAVEKLSNFCPNCGADMRGEE